MLQKVDKDRLDKVLEVIETAKIKFPNATITKELGAHGGTVSAYLNGKKPMSSNFYRKFMDKYGSEKNEESQKSQDLNSLIENNIKLIKMHKDAVHNSDFTASSINALSIANKELAEANKELTMMLKNSLSSNANRNSQDLSEEVVQRIAEGGTLVFWPSKEEGINILNNILIGKPQNKIESSILLKESKSGTS